MSYRLKLREALGEGVRRVALDQLDLADAKLKSTDDAAAAVHDARRCLKRLRALLRLVRLGLEDSLYDREAKRLATTGRLLAGARDQHVMSQTLLLLEARYGALPEGGAVRIGALLAAGDHGEPQKVEEARRRALSRLNGSRKFFQGSALEKVAMEDVFAGAEKVYRRARRERRRCHQSPSDEAYHSWRKSVQQHWRHMQLLSRAWPDELGARASEAKELSQLLGQDHDLSVLGAFVQANAELLPAAAVSAVASQVRQFQEQLRVLAGLRGARLFAEGPQELTERLSTYWAAARKIASALADEPTPSGAPAPLETPSPAGPAADVTPLRPSQRKRATA